MGFTPTGFEVAANHPCRTLKPPNRRRPPHPQQPSPKPPQTPKNPETRVSGAWFTPDWWQPAGASTSGLACNDGNTIPTTWTQSEPHSGCRRPAGRPTSGRSGRRREESELVASRHDLLKYGSAAVRAAPNAFSNRGSGGAWRAGRVTPFREGKGTRDSVLLRRAAIHLSNTLSPSRCASDRSLSPRATSRFCGSRH
jgi:hypothetical protein